MMSFFGSIVIAIGFVIMAVAQLAFRKADANVAWQFAPIWSEKSPLTKAGKLIFMAGTATVLIGAMIEY